MSNRNSNFVEGGKSEERQEKRFQPSCKLLHGATMKRSLPSEYVETPDAAIMTYLCNEL